MKGVSETFTPRKSGANTTHKLGASFESRRNTES